MWQSLSVTCGRFGGFLHQYNWNIVESGVKHNNPNPHRNRYRGKIDTPSTYILYHITLTLIETDIEAKLIPLAHIYYII
jgi:hypothetical protein